MTTAAPFTRVSFTAAGVLWLLHSSAAAQSSSVTQLERELTRISQAAPGTSASRAFLASRKDQGTPESMARLLSKIWQGKALSAASTEVLKGIMFREETGKDRIRGWLPKGTRVANKTGTLATVANNDVGVIDLPDGTHVVLAVYLRDIKSGTPPAEPNRIIAEIGRAVYDFFVFNPSP